MSLFNRSSSSTPGTSTDQNAKKLKVMSQVKQELEVARLQELINNMTQRCYTVCQPSGSALSNKDQACLSNCMDRFFEAFDVVSRTYVQRLGKERQAAAASSTTAESLGL